MPTETQYANADAELYGYSVYANRNYGAAGTIYLRNKDGTIPRVGVFNFDLTALVGKTISSFTFSIYPAVSIPEGTVLRAARILPVNAGWVEGNKNGTTAGTGEVCWNYKEYGVSRWAGDAASDGGADAGCSILGTDISNTYVEVTAPVGGWASGTKIDFAFTQAEAEAMVANNAGIYLWTTTETAFSVYSRSDATKKPTVVADYSNPANTYDKTHTIDAIVAGTDRTHTVDAIILDPDDVGTGFIPEDRGLAYSDNFTDGVLDPGWSAIQGTWVEDVGSGSLQCGDFGINLIQWATIGSIRDVQAQVYTVIYDVTNRHSVLVRYQDAQNYYELRNDGSTVTLYKVVGGSETSLGSYYLGSGIQTICMRAVGSSSTRLLAYVQDQTAPCIDVTDNASPHQAGSVVLRGYRPAGSAAGVAFDAFDVKPADVTVSNSPLGWYFQLSDGTNSETIAATNEAATIPINALSQTKNQTYTVTAWEGDPAVDGKQYVEGQASVGDGLKLVIIDYRIVQDPVNPGRGYYWAVFVDDTEQWRHADYGDFDLTVTDGATPATYTNECYDSYSVDSTGLITTCQRTIAAGLTLTAVVTNRRKKGVYKLEYKFTSTTEKRANLTKRLTGTCSGTSGFTGAGLYNEASTIDGFSKDVLFHALAIHRTGGPTAVLSPGNGYDNDYSYYTGGLKVDKQAASIQFGFGKLHSGVTDDYSVHFLAGIQYTHTMMVGLGHTYNSDRWKRLTYNAYFDAFAADTNYHLAYNDQKKAFWSTAHWLVQTKRHSHTEPKYQWVAQSQRYQDTYWTAQYNIFGLNDSDIIARDLQTTYNLGQPTEAGYSWWRADTTMDASYVPNPDYRGNDVFLIAYATRWHGYTPDATEISKYVTLAGKIVGNIGHIYPWGWRNFELQALYTSGAGQDIYKYEANNVGTGGAIRTQVVDGITPYEGSWMVKLTGAAAGDVGRMRMLRSYLPPGYQYSLQARINIPSAFASGGFRFNVWEYDSAGTQLANHQSGYTTSTTGWEQTAAYTFTPNASVAYIVTVVEAVDVGSVYVDEVEFKFVSPPYPGMLFDIPFNPDSCYIDWNSFLLWNHMYAIGNLEAIKYIAGASWTQDLETGLQNIRATCPAAFWHPTSTDCLRFTLWHPIRKDWIYSPPIAHPQFFTYIGTGQKILTDAEMARVYNSWPRSDFGAPYGAHGMPGMAMKHDGTYTEQSEWVGWGNPGEYDSGGEWTWVNGPFHLAAWYGGVSAASTNLEQLFKIHFHHDWESHEWLDDAGPYRGTCPSGIPTNGFGHGYNVLALSRMPDVAVSNSVDLQWAVRGLAQQSSQLIWHTRAPAIGQAELLWHTRAVAAAEAALQWLTRSVAKQDVDLRWGVRSVAQQSAALQWAVRQAVPHGVDLRWNQHALVNGTAQLLWNVIGSVIGALALQWHTRQAVTQGADLLWHVRQVANQSTDLQWAVRQNALQSVDLLWALAGFVLQQSDLRWSVRSIAQQSRQLLWDVRQAVPQGADLRWDVRYTVPQALQLLWDVQSSTGAVANSLQLLWAVRAPVLGQSQLLWHTRRTVEQSADLQWAVRTFLTQSTDLAWLVRQAVQQPVDLRWTVAGGVTGSADLRWDVRQALAQSAELRWAVRQAVQQSSQLLWIVREPVTGSVVFIWRVQSEAVVPKLLSPTYAVLVTDGRTYATLVTDGRTFAALVDDGRTYAEVQAG